MTGASAALLNYGQEVGQTVFLCALFVLFYFFAIRPSRTKERRRMRMVAALKAGDGVVLSSGIIGTYVGDESSRSCESGESSKLGEAEKEYVIRVADGVEVRSTEMGIIPQASSALPE
jgi:preprotein translocase subunit YajC